MSSQQWSIQQALEWARAALSKAKVSDDGNFDSSRVDSKALLAAVLQKELVYLHTWPEKLLDAQQAQAFKQAVEQRVLGHPVAHITGYRDFWSLRLAVSNSTLIPRPETELLIELVLALNLPNHTKVLDLGTGTGAIALSLAVENPNWQITAVDKSSEAVALAKQNAQNLNLPQVQIKQSDWFAALAEQKFDLILSNPPYIENDNNFLQKGDVRFEPASALTSGADGLDDIRLIVAQCPTYLTPGGVLAIEHGYQQQAQVQSILAEHGLQNIRTEKDLNHLPRVTVSTL